MECCSHSQDLQKYGTPIWEWPPYRDSLFGWRKGIVTKHPQQGNAKMTVKFLWYRRYHGKVQWKMRKSFFRVYTSIMSSSQDHYQEKPMKAASIVFGNLCSLETHMSILLLDQTSVLGTFSNGSLQRGATTMNVWSEKQAVDRWIGSVLKALVKRAWVILCLVYVASAQNSTHGALSDYLYLYKRHIYVYI